ncbi:MAG: DNA methyltransferase [Planctomycetes bacterium]|nr:DNA methyltransferase [Planctomycetota bacterium]
MLKSYLKGIHEVSSRGDAREESFYSVLEGFLQKYTESTNKKSIHITTLPKKTDAGNPDFRIWDGNQHIVGYIEAKAPTTEYMDQTETTDQLKRYLKTFPNLILTNFFEFRLYRNGNLIDKVRIGRPFVMHTLKTVPPAENEPDFFKLLEKFFSFSLPKFYDAESLARVLADKTRFLRDEVITQELREEEEEGKRKSITGFYEAFKQYLISDLTKEGFADLYSQTITYGLFASRVRARNGFNRELAHKNIPHTIGILRDIFKFISLEELPKQMEWIVDDIAEVLAVTDVKNILHQYFHKGKGEDPIIHFYETFLAEYDPQTRECRGVYYTPEPVVSYIVRSLHTILKESFNRKYGFANESVTVLDPAAGTLTFLAEASKLALEEFCSKYGEGGRERLIKEHILRNFYAFELMMAPYAIGHLKMSFLLEELGYRLKDDDRIKLYLTNTLEMKELDESKYLGPGWFSISEESHLAGKVKREQPILVILGNPPYSGHSSNIGDWISREIKAYYQVDGKPLGEKNPKWLQDDYVKFIRFAQWKIDQAGEGVLGFITNHSYLDNPTFRGMRQSLMNSFDEIYVLDLHGNSLKKEKCPDGSKDENVFDIQQGVTIALFVKRADKKDGCKVHHSEIWGLREQKYRWLLKNDINTTKWKRISPKSEFYLFIPREERLLKEYERYPKITDIFIQNSVGIVTARDNFVIDSDRERLKQRIRMFIDEKMPDEIIRQTFHLKDTSNWKLNVAREKTRKDTDWENTVTRILYRPFDVQWIFYHNAVIERPRKEVMQHMMKENLGLITRRQMLSNKPCNYVFISGTIISDGVIRSDNKGSESLFPLYLYPETDNSEKQSLVRNLMLFEPKADFLAKKPNFSSTIIEQLTKNYKKTPSPEQIFFYIYAILYSNIYRTKYAEFLRLDFPRIPFTKGYKLFITMGDYGKRLVDLHLLKSPELDPPTAKFQGKGDNKVEKLRYEGTSLFINEYQYFEGIEPEVFEYQIGGYQVCEKWLKDRKDRKLSLDDIKHYCNIATTLKKTIDIQREIDNIYPKVEDDIRLVYSK